MQQPCVHREKKRERKRLAGRVKQDVKGTAAQYTQLERFVTSKNCTAKLLQPRVVIPNRLNRSTCHAGRIKEMVMKVVCAPLARRSWGCSQGRIGFQNHGDPVMEPCWFRGAELNMIT